jgi:AcrR family transcriptional regulator
MIDTKEKIMDTAAELFGEQGFAATSLRQIIAKAEVNLAAIHYHFGSKENLLDELIHRKVEPVNLERIARLDRLEAEAGGKPVAVEAILEAFFAPTAVVAQKNPIFVRVMGRIHSEGLMPAIVQKHFHPTAKRFLTALRRTLPDLPESEFLWRVHFMMGAMAHTMCGNPIFPAGSDDYHGRMQKLATFLSAGFRAPATPNGESQ